MEPPRVLKLVLNGDSAVGKTSLVLRFAQNSFSETQTPTLSGDFAEKDVQVDGETVRLQIWDTAGQEKYRVITSSFYKATCLYGFLSLSHTLGFARMPMPPLWCTM
jgi:small GTP-binding protein